MKKRIVKSLLLFSFLSATTATDSIHDSKSWVHDTAGSPVWSSQPTTMTSFTESNSSCIESLYDIMMAEANLFWSTDSTSTPQLRAYILCPNTVYRIDDTLNSLQVPLVLGLPNLYIQCGASGHSDNNCVLQGGQFQAHLSPLLLQQAELAANQTSTTDMLDRVNSITRPIENVVLQGITFTASTSFNVLAEYPGDLLLKDCIFRDNHQAISLVFAHMLQRNTVQNSSLRKRILEESSTDKAPSIFVDECIFQDNSIWSYSGISVDGLLTAQDGAILTVRNSLFVGNTFESSDLAIGYLLSVISGELYLKENCFIANDAHIVTAIVEDSLVAASHNFLAIQQPDGDNKTTNKTMTPCPFVAAVTTGSLLAAGVTGMNEQTEFSCADADSQVCLAKPFSVQQQLSDRVTTCVDSLQQIQQMEDKVQDENLQRTYILCPDTFYVIDEAISSTQQTAGLVLNKPNVRLYCGGLAATTAMNNCIWTGGTVQVAVQKTHNVYIRGMTFTNAARTNVQVLGKNVTVENCLFEDNKNEANILAGPSTMDTASVATKSVKTWITETHQFVPTELTVQNCTFAHNSIGAVGRDHDGSSGIITSFQAQVRVVGCLFTAVENHALLNDITYLIGSFEGSTLELYDNCFDENQVSASAVVVEGADHLRFRNNFGRNTNSKHSYECDLALILSDEEKSFSCAQFNGTSCDALSLQQNKATIPSDDLAGAWRDKSDDNGASLTSSWMKSSSAMMSTLGSLIVGILAGITHLC